MQQAKALELISPNHRNSIRRSQGLRMCGSIGKDSNIHIGSFFKIQATLRAISSTVFYFGQPSAGFFLDRDFFTRSFQFPLSFNLSAFGPGVAFFLEWFELLTAFFLLTSLNILPLRNWVFVHQSLSFGCFHGKDGAFAIIQLPIVPEEIELPEIAMQIFAADVVIDADETAPDECMAAFRSVNVDIATRIFQRPMANRFVGACPTLDEANSEIEITSSPW
jgi:hypothetical protein